MFSGVGQIGSFQSSTFLSSRETTCQIQNSITKSVVPKRLSPVQRTVRGSVLPVVILC
jgi:hypothetical protein